MIAMLTVPPSSSDPRLTDYDTLLDNINGLIAGRPVEVPIYDFKLSARSGTRCSPHLQLPPLPPPPIFFLFFSFFSLFFFLLINST